MIDEDGIIRTEEGPYLLAVGDVVAFPESSWAATVTRVTDAGIRLEFVEWILGSPHHEEVWSWEKVLSWPAADFVVFGDGYYLSEASNEVHRATDRKLAEAKRIANDPTSTEEEAKAATAAALRPRS